MLESEEDKNEQIKLEVDQNQEIRNIYQKKESSLDLYLNGVKLTNQNDDVIGVAEWGTGSWVGPYKLP